MSTNEGYMVTRKKHRAALNRCAYLEVQLEQTRRSEANAVEAYMDLRRVLVTGWPDEADQRLERHDEEYGEIRTLDDVKAGAQAQANVSEVVAQEKAAEADADPRMAKLLSLLALAKEAGINL